MDLITEKVERTRCHHCEAEFDTSAAQPLATTRCPSCGKSVRVPAGFDQFVLLSELGRGATGRVYKALDRRLQRHVAVKVLRSGGDDEQVAIECMREARALATLSHRSIVHIYRMGRFRHQPFIVMELIVGGSCEAFLRPGAQPSDVETMTLGIRVAEGLEAARQMDLVHMDVKPGNILLDVEGNPKLIDFGSAQFAAGVEEDGIIGTPYYIAPETARGTRPDFKADMYSLGATLFHILSGRPPFPGTEADEVVARRLVEAAPDVRRFRSGVHRDCATVIARLLETDSDRRYASYDQLIEKLLEATRQAELAETVSQQVAARQLEKAVETPASMVFRSPLVIAACVLLLLVVSGGIVGALVQTHQSPPPNSPMIPRKVSPLATTPFVDPTASDARLEIQLEVFDPPTAAFVGRPLQLRVQAKAVGAGAVIATAPGTRLVLVDADSGRELAASPIGRLGQPVLLQLETDRVGPMALRPELIVPTEHGDRLLIKPASVTRISWTRAPLPLTITGVEPSTNSPIKGETMSLQVTLGPNPLATDLFDPSRSHLVLHLLDRETGIELARARVEQTTTPVTLSIRPTSSGRANWAAVLVEASDASALADRGQAIEGIHVLPARTPSEDSQPIARWDFERGAISRGKLGTGASIVTDPERGRVLSLDGTKLGYLADTLPVPPQEVSVAAWIRLAKNKPTAMRITETGQVITPRQLILTKWNDEARRFALEFALTGRHLTVNLGISGGRSNIAPPFAADRTPLLAEHGWTHVAMTVTAATPGQPGSARLYRDGKLVDSSARYGETRLPEIPGPLVLGSKTQSRAAFALHGFLDDVLVYDRALPESEIRKLFEESRKSDMKAPTPPSPTPPTIPSPPAPPSVAKAERHRNGLVGHWTLDQVIDGAVASRVGEFPGTLRGPKESTSLFSPGRIGDGAIELKHPGFVDLGETMPIGAYTKAAWIRMGPGILQYILAGKNHALWAPRQQGAYRLQVGHNATLNSITDRSPIEVGKWYHVAVTYDPGADGGELILYRDGKEAGRASAIGPIENDRSLQIGGQGARGAFVGRIDDVRIFDRALTAEEVDSVFTGTPLSAGPAAEPMPPPEPTAGVPNPPVPPVATNNGPVRLYVNAGKANATEGGRDWVASPTYKAGAFGHVGRLQLEGALDPRSPLLSSRAWAPAWSPFEYRFDLPNGRYKVVVYFAQYWNRRDKHTVQVKIQDKTVLRRALDLSEVRYRQRRTVVYDDAVVSNGRLVIEFLGEKPYVNALSVESIELDK